MNWFMIEKMNHSETMAMDIGNGVLVRSSSWEESNEGSTAMSESMCFVPDCQVVQGSDGERAKVTRRTHSMGRRGPG